MRIKFRSQIMTYVAGGALLLALLACAAPAAQGPATPTLISLPQGDSTQTSEEPPAALPTATAVIVGSAGAGAPLDLCTLATPAEVEAVIGGPVVKTTFSQEGQDCVLMRDDTHLLIVQAGHDADGKTMHVGAMEGNRSKVTDQTALRLLDEIVAQQATLTLPALVEKGLPYWRATGFTAEVEPGIGDWAVWFYGPQLYFGNLAEMGAGRASGAWVAVYTNAPDEATGKALLRPLLITLLDRLPDDFTPTGTSK